MSAPGTRDARASATTGSRYWHPRHVDVAEKSTAIRRVLALARENLAMDVGYFGTFADGEQTYQVVEPAHGRVGPPEGSAIPVDQTLCWQVVSGNMGNAVQDTRHDVVTCDLRPVTDEGVRAYLGVPVHADGELLGMLCLISSEPRPELGAPDISAMRLFAQVVALELTEDKVTSLRDAHGLEVVRASLDPASYDPVVVFQPIARIAAWLNDRVLQVRSVEALSRFTLEPGVGVEDWFGLAWRHGLGVELEMVAIERAFDALPLLPEPIRLAVNASPETIASSRLRDAIPLDQAHRITLELTEHVLVDDYDSLRPGLERVRATGVSLAIDDLGTGSSNLQHIIELAPEVIKVDLSITDGVERDARRRALVSALVSFAHDTGMTLVTEGVERLATAHALDRIGVEYGQGFLLSRALRAHQLPQLASL